MIILGNKHLLAKLSCCTSSHVLKPQLVSKSWYAQRIYDFFDINQWMCISLQPYLKQSRKSTKYCTTKSMHMKNLNFAMLNYNNHVEGKSPHKIKPYMFSFINHNATKSLFWGARKSCNVVRQNKNYK